MSSSVVVFVAGLGILLFTLELLRRRHLREKYAVLWLGVSILVSASAFFPAMISKLSQALGFELPSNFLLLVAMLLLLLVAMQLSLEVGRLEDKTERLAQEVAILRAQTGQPPSPSDTER